MGRKRVDLSSGTKKCPGCQTVKPVSEYWPSKSTMHGLTVYCKTCTTDRHRGWRQENLGWAAAQAKKWRANNPERSRDHMLKSHYGIEIGTYDKMFADQKGLCAICSTDQPGAKRFHVDHCHDTQKIRGLLCHHCNVGIGNLRHSEAVLRSAIDYLSRTSQ